MDFEEYQYFDFNYGKIMAFCDSLEGINQQIAYLKWVLIELEHCGEHTDPILKLGYKKYLSDIENTEVEDNFEIAPEYGN